jgi:FSR family fosmidomycin resistance protein-like MFS transporter
MVPERDMNKKMLALLGFGHAITDINQGALPIILTLVQPLFGLSQTQVGLAVLAFNLSSSVIQPVFGIMSDRFRAAWLVPLGCLLAGLGMGLTGLSPNYFWLLLAALLSGIGIAAFHPESSRFARFFSGWRKAAGMSLFSVGGNLGFAFGPLLASLCYEAVGLKGTLGFVAINGMMAVVLWTNIPRLEPVQAPIAEAPAVRKDKGVPGKASGRIGPGLVRALVLLVLVVIMRSWINLGVSTFLPQYYVHHLHQSQLLAAVMTSVFLLAGAVGTLVGGPLADRLGLKTVIVGSMAAVLPLLYLLTVVSGAWSAVVVAVTGFAVISTFAVTVVLGQELLPNNVGLASGLTMGLGIGMGGVGTTLLGWVADHLGLPAVFHVMLLFPLLGLLFALFLPGRRELKRMSGEPAS